MRRCARTAARSSRVSTARTPGSDLAASVEMLADQRMGMRAAHESSVQKSSDYEIVNEAPAPTQKCVVFEAKYACADQRRHWLGFSFVMPGLVPGIHVLTRCAARKTWIAGTSPAMTRYLLMA